MTRDRLVRRIGAGVAVYEATALIAESDRIPPITRIARAHPVLAGILLALLAVHFRPDGPF